jgi:hypothetical protein
MPLLDVYAVLYTHDAPEANAVVPSAQGPQMNHHAPSSCRVVDRGVYDVLWQPYTATGCARVILWSVLVSDLSYRIYSLSGVRLRDTHTFSWLVMLAERHLPRQALRLGAARHRAGARLVVSFSPLAAGTRCMALDSALSEADRQQPVVPLALQSAPPRHLSQPQCVPTVRIMPASAPVHANGHSSPALFGHCLRLPHGLHNITKDTSVGHI